MARIALVMSLRNVSEYIDFEKNLVQNLESDDVVIVICQDIETYKSVKRNLKLPKKIQIHVIFMSEVGLSNGRNKGIDFLVSNSINCDFLLFPNLLTLYPMSTLTFIRNLEHKQIAPVYVGAWIDINEDLLMKPHHVYNNVMKFSRIYEPGLVIPFSCFLEGFRFNSLIGTGAQSMRQSGEGSDLVYRLFKHGYQVIGAREIEVINPGSSRNLGLQRSTIKGFMYGYGNGGFYARNVSVANYPNVFIRLIAPTLAYLVRKNYWTQEGFLFSIASTAGRLLGFFIETIRKCLSPTLK